MGGDSKLNAVLEDAEKLLLQGDFFGAEKCSRTALSIAARLTDADEKHLFGDRAAAVLLQALFETNRFSNARPSLVTAFGSIEKAPPNSVLVWLSLALDTDEKCNAQSLMLNLLQAGPCRGAPKSGYGYRGNHFLPLDPREKHFLEDEVEAAAAAASLAAENGDDGSSGGNSLHGKVGGAGTGQGIEPSGSTDLDYTVGSGGGTKNVLPSVNAGINSGAFESGRRRTDYNSMPLPTDQISPMKKLNQNSSTNDINTRRRGGNGGGGNAQSPAVAIASADQQTPPYRMSFSPVPSDLPFGTLAEYENEHGHHHHTPHHHLRHQQYGDGEHHASSVSSPANPSAMSPHPSGDLDGMTSAFSSRK
ncbi:hypothetical protein Ndes2526B_g05375 [Nannochloris sp. 'desiccata']